MEAPEHLWVILLAGGEGRRVAHLTTGPAGRTVPKQFWRFRQDASPLRLALERALRLSTADHIVAVVAQGHREWWQPDLRPLPAGNTLAQSANRGTAVGILVGLGHVMLHDRASCVVVLPSDHDVEDEKPLRRAVELAAESARRWRECAILVGMTPEGPDADYGWIVPECLAGGLTRPVRAFIEKPPCDEAHVLFRHGALWNSLILAASGPALLNLFEHAQPALLAAYRAALARVRWRTHAVAEYDRDLPAADFGHDVLERATGYLRVLAAPPCGWTDLGTPERVASWLARRHGAPARLGRSTDLRTSHAA